MFMDRSRYTFVNVEMIASCNAIAEGLLAMDDRFVQVLGKEKDMELKVFMFLFLLYT